LSVYKVKTQAFMKMAECCKTVEKYDEAIKLLRKALQYAWEYNLANKELKCYDTLGKLYYIKGNPKKALYYHERCSQGELEPKDSPIRELYNMFLVDHGERGKFGKHKQLDSDFMKKIVLPSLPGDNVRRHSIISTLSNVSYDGIWAIEMSVV